MALVSALLLLLVLTMLAVGMFRSFGLQEHIAGNTRERQRALHAAAMAQSYAEWWLSANKGANAQVGGDCHSLGAVTSPQICTQSLATPASLPWSNYVSYLPPLMTVGSAGTADNYIQKPQFYITWLSGFYDKTSGTAVNNYLIDANGYAGNLNAAAVVESSFSVSVTYTAQNTNTKFVNLGGQ
jgi:type IV pilus assembly protein PilX